MPKKAVVSEARRCLLNVRTTEAIRKKLEEAATISGRTLIHEIEHRIEMSFWQEEKEKLEKEIFVTKDNAELADAVKMAVGYASKYCDEEWTSDGRSRQVVTLAVNKVLDHAFSLFEDGAAAKEELPPESVEQICSFISAIALSSAFDGRLSKQVKAALLKGGTSLI